MRRLFEDVGVLPALAPAADVYETDGEFVVELEVPGFYAKELEIEA
jgi:HSP20 family molecular chaperone IbpA